MYGIKLTKFSLNSKNGTVDEYTYFSAEPGYGHFAKVGEISHLNKVKDTVSLTKNPKIGDKVETINGIAGTVRYHFFSILLFILIVIHFVFMQICWNNKNW